MGIINDRHMRHFLNLFLEIAMRHQDPVKGPCKVGNDWSGVCAHLDRVMIRRQLKKKGVEGRWAKVCPISPSLFQLPLQGSVFVWHTIFRRRIIARQKKNRSCL